MGGRAEGGMNPGDLFSDRGGGRDGIGAVGRECAAAVAVLPGSGVTYKRAPPRSRDATNSTGPVKVGGLRVMSAWLASKTM